MVLTRVAGFILEIGGTAKIQANDRKPLWRPPSTGSTQPSGHPLPAHERAAGLLVRIELLPTPERGRMARQMAGRMAVLRGGDLNRPASPRQRWSVPQHNTQWVGVHVARSTP